MFQCVKISFRMLNYSDSRCNANMPPVKRSIPSYSVPALEHGLDVLELLLSQHKPLLQNEIAGRLCKPASTVFRLLACLEQRGYVSRDPVGGSYRPTLRLYGLAQLEPAHRRFCELAFGPMQELSERVGECCHLSVLDEGEVRVIANQRSPHGHSLDVRLGSTYPAHQASSGKLLLSHLPLQRARGILESRGYLAAISLADQRALTRELNKLRRQSWSISPSGLTPGVLDIDVHLSCDWLGSGVVLVVSCLRKWTRTEQRELVLPAAQATGKKIIDLIEKSNGTAEST